MEWLQLLLGTVAAFMLSCGLLLAVRAWHIYCIRREYGRIPLTDISDLNQEGRVRVRGTVAPSSLTLKSFFSSERGVYFQGKIYAPRSGVRTWKESARTVFLVKQKGAGAVVNPAEGKFIVGHRTFSGRELASRYVPSSWKNRIADAVVMEEYLGLDDEVTVLGDFKNGVIGGSRTRPVLVVQCSPEAFQLIYMRIFVRTVLLAFSFALTAILQFAVMFWMRG